MPFTCFCGFLVSHSGSSNLLTPINYPAFLVAKLLVGFVSVWCGKYTVRLIARTIVLLFVTVTSRCKVRPMRELHSLTLCCVRFWSISSAGDKCWRARRPFRNDMTRLDSEMSSRVVLGLLGPHSRLNAVTSVA